MSTITVTRPRPISTAPRDGEAVLLLLPEHPPYNGADVHESRFAVAYWNTEPGVNYYRWQALAGGLPVRRFRGALVGYDDEEVEGWYPLPAD